MNCFNINTKNLTICIGESLIAQSTTCLNVNLVGTMSKLRINSSQSFRFMLFSWLPLFPGTRRFLPFSDTEKPSNKNTALMSTLIFAAPKLLKNTELIFCPHFPSNLSPLYSHKALACQKLSFHSYYSDQFRHVSFLL